MPLGVLAAYRDKPVGWVVRVAISDRPREFMLGLIQASPPALRSCVYAMHVPSFDIPMAAFRLETSMLLSSYRQSGLGG